MFPSGILELPKNHVNNPGGFLPFLPNRVSPIWLDHSTRAHLCSGNMFWSHWHKLFSLSYFPLCVWHLSPLKEVTCCLSLWHCYRVILLLEEKRWVCVCMRVCVHARVCVVLGLECRDSPALSYAPVLFLLFHLRKVPSYSVAQAALGLAS